MNPRRLHSETIFSISGFSFGSAISRAVFLNDGLMSREAHTARRPGAHLGTAPGARLCPKDQPQHPRMPSRGETTSMCRSLENSLIFFRFLGDTAQVVQFENRDPQPTAKSKEQQHGLVLCRRRTTARTCF